jgi:nucleoside-diphosphate-sugar epimerase
MPKNKAVVVGSLGVMGRYIIDRLLAESDWDVVGLSRRPQTPRPRFVPISVDLLDGQDAERKLSALTDATHVVYAAFQTPNAQTTGNAASFASVIAPNRDMLIHAVSTIERVAPGLQRVVLITGNKYYGSHLGPFRTPAKESDPRHLGPNYYFDQIDWLTARQTGKAWTWTELRPHTLSGFSPGTAMSILPAIAVYAGICKELGLPLRFPGKPTAFRSIYQVTESGHMANAVLWAATSPKAANEAYNITNGDFFRWANVWPRIADVFEMPVGDVQTISLTQQMAAMAPVWDAMVRRHGLQAHRFDEIVAWPFADYVFATDWDVMTSTVKARKHGFHDVVDTEEMLIRQLGELRRARIVP